MFGKSEGACQMHWMPSCKPEPGVKCLFLVFSLGIWPFPEQCTSFRSDSLWTVKEIRAWHLSLSADTRSAHSTRKLLPKPGHDWENPHWCLGIRVSHLSLRSRPIQSQQQAPSIPGWLDGVDLLWKPVVLSRVALFSCLLSRLPTCVLKKQQPRSKRAKWKNASRLTCSRSRRSCVRR